MKIYNSFIVVKRILVSIMSKVDEMRHIYQLYLLNDKNVGKTLTFTKKRRPTIMSYIKLIECLDFELLEYIDIKGHSKLTIDMAMYIVKHVQNFDEQLILYDKIKTKKKQEKKIEIVEYSSCLICADNYPVFEILECCNNRLCEKCLFNIIDKSINSVSFTNIRCPFCNIIFSRNTIKYYLIESKKQCEWKNSAAYESFHQKNSDGILYTRDFYRTNLFRKFKIILHNIYSGVLSRNSHEIEDIFEELCNDKVFGVCNCCPKVSDIQIQIHSILRYKIKAIDKQCVNDDGGEVVIKSHMFKCEECEEKEKVVFKKCPHCGIKTMTPDGCNYVRCVCRNFWCFICNHRLPNSYNGHNTHFHIGPGTSAYDNACRTSVNYHNESHIMGLCNCRYCIWRSRQSLCCEIECNKKAEIDSVKCVSCR